VAAGQSEDNPDTPLAKDEKLTPMKSWSCGIFGTCSAKSRKSRMCGSGTLRNRLISSDGHAQRWRSSCPGC